jgi:hypothetical protein
MRRVIRSTDTKGRPFFGFVKNANGGSVSDAKLTLAAKARDTVITCSNSAGAYRVSLGSDVDANDNVICCEKVGFEKVRVFRRTAQSARIQISLETECELVADQ